ncbi:MAG: NAD(+)/NADH kinase [Candidatus Neomarinimicrobiota bacterium]|nr:NAD(+)/NADH kinase [Candidatus Neomarinimicrobiota bacterium]
MKKPSTFGIWGNTEKKSFWETLPMILNWAKEKGLEAYITTRIMNHKKGPGLPQNVINSKDEIGVLDFMLVLGGDGTFLSMARAIQHRQIPILGIHLGDLGFLAKVTLKDLFIRLGQVVDGDFILEKCMMVRASINKNGKMIHHIGLNDFVLSNGESHRMLSAKVKVNQQLVGRYTADGLIIATPTGSTAYSLSAGGPIVAPAVDSLVITPISAHSLTSRPLVVPADSTIVLEFPNTEESILFIADGQIHESLDPSCVVEITKADYNVSLIDFKDCDYFQTLRTKMGWGKRGES